MKEIDDFCVLDNSDDVDFDHSSIEINNLDSDLKRVINIDFNRVIEIKEKLVEGNKQIEIKRIGAKKTQTLSFKKEYLKRFISLLSEFTQE